MPDTHYQELSRHKRCHSVTPTVNSASWPFCSAKPAVSMCHMHTCKSLAEIKSESSTIITIDELKEFDFNGVKSYVKIDALYQNENTQQFIVVDWKSGKGNEIEVEQLLLYVYFVHKMYTIPAQEIEARLEYLADGDCASYRFTDNDMQIAEEIINSDIKKMQRYLFDKERNIPLPEAYFPANESSKCKYCNYIELCFEKEYEVGDNKVSLMVNC